ncbi:MAG: hypothetical protein FWE41_05185 [Coriobacteriia bacterium]|nr:hypothetical protein [Coriobacteriia bacterium]MCL2749665.1 hypothetical protein [Coriobacteriia bacterium]
MAAQTPQIQTIKPLTSSELALTPTLDQSPSVLQRIGKAFSGLSFRERFLLWGLLIIAVVLLLAFFLIIPASDNLNAAQDNREVLRTEELTTRMTIAAIPTNQEILQSSQARHAEYLLLYQAPLYPEEVDRMLTSLIHDSGFTAASLNLNQMQLEYLTGFLPPEPSWQIPNPQVDAGTGAAGSEVTEDEDAAADDAGAAPPASETTTGAASALGGEGVQVIDVQITVVGNTQNFYAFLDRVLPLSWIKVSSTDFTPTGPYGGYNPEEAYVINLKIYINADAKSKQI